MRTGVSWKRRRGAQRHLEWWVTSLRSCARGSRCPGSFSMSLQPPRCSTPYQTPHTHPPRWHERISRPHIWEAFSNSFAVTDFSFLEKKKNFLLNILGCPRFHDPKILWFADSVVGRFWKLESPIWHLGGRQLTGPRPPQHGRQSPPWPPFFLAFVLLTGHVG